MKKTIEIIKSKIFDQYDKDPPLDNDVIERISETLDLPEDYNYWMQWANGGEGRFGEMY
ncbi:hypothetical protein [Cohnella terricola]|uniref:hypothetical protein n=1 Tax=Cohnella terricola TaxID=1289167 RepID=UPI0016465FE1|nr:hypothetical protein [Cohnella terricola]